MTASRRLWLAVSVMGLGLLVWVAFDHDATRERDAGVRRIETVSGPEPELSAQVEAVAVRTAVADRSARRWAGRGRDDNPAAPPPVHVLVSSATQGEFIEGRLVLLDGTPVPRQFVGTRPSDESVPEPDRFRAARRQIESSRSSPTDVQGRFRLGPLEPGLYDVELLAEWQAVEGIVRGVPAPTRWVEIRIDALLVELEVPPHALDSRSNPATSERGGIQRENRLHIQTVGPPGTSSSSTRLSFDEHNVMRMLLAAGPGYLFELETTDGDVYAGQLAPAARSGLHRVRLSETPNDSATVRVLVTGAAPSPTLRVAVELSPLGGGRGPALRRTRRISVPEGMRHAEDGAVPPGRYGVHVSLHDPFPSMLTPMTIAVTTVDEVELQTGATTDLEVQLLPAGRLGVHLNGRYDVDVPRPVLERFDEKRERWENLTVAVPTRGEFARPTAALSLKRTSYASAAFPPGPLRLRLSGNGWRTIEATVSISTGNTTIWQPRAERR